jgi:hypothetical protein
MISKLQQLIENYHFPCETGLSYTLSPKFGIASFPFREETMEETMEKTQKIFKKKKLNDGQTIEPVNSGRTGS